jgi:hypothetical protein
MLGPGDHAFFVGIRKELVRVGGQAREIALQRRTDDRIPSVVELFEELPDRVRNLYGWSLRCVGFSVLGKTFDRRSSE